ncbi:hypothetical protein ABIA19_004628 [Sinorhizobium fredii]
MFSTIRKMVWLQLETPDDFALGKRDFQEMRGRLADARHDRAVAVFGTVDNDGFSKIETVPERAFKLGIGAHGRDDGCADDALRFGALEHSRHRRLRKTEMLGDFSLALALDVIHLSDARHQAKFV